MRKTSILCLLTVAVFAACEYDSDDITLRDLTSEIGAPTAIVYGYTDETNVLHQWRFDAQMTYRFYRYDDECHVHVSWGKWVLEGDTLYLSENMTHPEGISCYEDLDEPVATPDQELPVRNLTSDSFEIIRQGDMWETWVRL